MKTKEISNRIFKFLIAILIVAAYSPFLPSRQEKAEAASNPLTYKYEGFSGDAISQFAFDGAAEIPNGANYIRLTPASPLASGAVFNTTELHPQNNYSFSTVFSFQISNPDSTELSDGLTFTIQRGISTQDANGGGLGYYGISPSFAIKYDTFLNTVYQDPSANYIGIAENGLVTNQNGWYTDLDQYNTANGTDFVLSNGTRYYTWIDYDGVNQNVQVRIGTSPDRADSHKVLDVNNIDLGAIFNGSTYYAGFTASTGYPNSENHDIYSWYLADDYAPIDYAQNRAPTAPGDAKTTTVDTPVSGQANGTDPDGDRLTYQAGLQPSHGSVAVNSDGTWTYTPAPGYTGSDNFSVIVDDGYGGTTTSTVTINVTEPPNLPPVSQNYNVTTQQGTSVTGSVYGNDPDGDGVSYTVGSDPQHGELALNPDGTWTYTPDSDYVGPDLFTVTLSDGKGGTTTSTIMVGVTEPAAPTPPPSTSTPPPSAPNQPPVASDVSATTPQGTSVTGSVYGTDPNGDSLTYAKGDDPQHGTVTVNPDGTWTYVPEAGYVGNDSFTVIVDDGKGGTTEVTVSVGVTEPVTPTPPPSTPLPPLGTPNQPPIVSDASVTTANDSSISGTVQGTDPDGDSLTYAKGDDPQHGTVTVNPDGAWTYTPEAGYVGQDRFTIVVNDGHDGTATSTITVDVTDPSASSAPPTATAPGTPASPPNTASQPPVTAGKGDSSSSSSSSSDSGTQLPSNDGGTQAKGANEDAQAPNRLPKTASNVYNLGFIGLIAIMAGWFMRRKRSKAE